MPKEVYIRLRGGRPALPRDEAVFGGGDYVRFDDESHARRDLSDAILDYARSNDG